MRILFLSSLMLLISISTCAQGQEFRRVTLYSAIGYFDRGGDWDTSRSTFNFETGKTERAKPSRNGIPEDYDISYDETEIGDHHDLFEVRDYRSMIVDLGKKKWNQFNETPSFPKGQSSAPPRPLTPTSRVHTSGTQVIADWRQFVKARSGHMYMARLMKGRRVIYVMFRVESLKSRDNCVLEWKKVQPPKVDNEK
jgi:hypothetical protein